MPTLEEILEAKRKAKAKAQLVGSPATVPATATATPTATAPVIVQHAIMPAATPAMSEKEEAPSQFATTLADKLRSMAQQQDWEDVEQSANSLSEILSVILSLPYCPDVFIDECIDNAACSLESQKNQYLRDVLNGKKQSGKRNKNVPSITTTASIDALDIDDLFVMGS